MAQFLQIFFAYRCEFFATIAMRPGSCRISSLADILEGGRR
jgi:hypothetical protein